MADDDTIVAEALRLIREHGEDKAFRHASLEMERMACAGDMTGLERMADVMLAIATLGDSADDRTIH